MQTISTPRNAPFLKTSRYTAPAAITPRNRPPTTTPKICPPARPLSLSSLKWREVAAFEVHPTRSVLLLSALALRSALKEPEDALEHEATQLKAVVA